MKKISILLLVLTLCSRILALDIEIDTIECINKIYDKNIKTVQFHLQDWEVSPPVAELNGEVGLCFEFDQVESQPIDYYYTIRHCTYDWQISNLMFMDYIDGFEENEIRNYEDAHSTFVQYTHFTLNLPNDDIKMKLSGNYILIVYAKEPTEHIVCTQRFLLYDNQIDVSGRVNSNLQSDFKTEYQKLDFIVNNKYLQIFNPAEELKISVLQNFQWDNAYYNLQPSFIANDTYTYNWDDRYIFNASNEFRYFSFNNLELSSEFVKNIEFRKPYYYIDLEAGKSKFFEPYSSVEDINGDFVIRTNRKYDNMMPELQSEYAIVHFCLQQPQPISAATVYIYGKLTNYELAPQYEMKYNLETRCYEQLLFLKQGYYNYQYIVVANESKANIDRMFFEGSHKETENDYYLLIYYRNSSASYDQLVNFSKFNSRN